MGQLGGDQRLRINSVDTLCSSNSIQLPNNLMDLPSATPPPPPPPNHHQHPKVKSKWRPEVPEINWQDCFCICFFFYLLCSDTESEKQRKSEKKAEKEMMKRRMKIVAEQEKEKKRRIKEMVKAREREDGGEKKMKSKRKKEKEDPPISRTVNRDHSSPIGTENGRRRTNETIKRIVNPPNPKGKTIGMVVEKEHSVNVEQQSTDNQLNPSKNETELINNLDSINLVNQTSATITVKWNDLN